MTIHILLSPQERISEVVARWQSWGYSLSNTLKGGLVARPVSVQVTHSALVLYVNLLRRPL